MVARGRASPASPSIRPGRAASCWRAPAGGDLGAFSVALDRLTYAAARPQASDVRAFAERLQAAL